MSGGKSRFRILPLTVQGITSPLGVHGQMRAPEMFNVCASPGPFRTDRATNPAPRRLLCRFIRPRRPIVAALSAYLTYLWLLAVPASALDPNKRITQYIHSAWSARDGSAPNGGYAIAQTADGFLWFVSGDLMTFDGVRFVPWDGPPNNGSIATNDTGFGQIMNAMGARAGGLWVLGIGGIVHLQGRIVTSHFELAGLRALQSMSEDPDGSLWVVRGDNRILDAPVCHITERPVQCFGKADGIPISPVNSILADGKGGFWLGGQTALAHWHNGVSEIYPIDALKSNGGRAGIARMALGPDGSLWIGIRSAGHGRGLGRLRNGAFQPFVTSSFDGSALAVESMVFDRDGNLWVGTGGQGLFRIHGDVVDHYGRAEGLSSDVVDAVLEDREGILWAASPELINKFRDPRVASFSVAEGLGNSPMGVLATRDGTIWIASQGSLDHIDKNGTISSIRPHDGLPGNQVAAMLEDHAGNLWVGIDDGLYLLSNGRFRRLPEPDDKPLGLVVGMAEDADGNIWAECFSNPRKLVRIRDFQVREEFPGSRVPSGRTVVPDPRGGVWIGTLKGDLALLRNGVAETFPLNAKSDPFIHQIVARGDGSVLAGSAEGLVGLRQGKVQRMTTGNGLPCNFVTSFVEDREKRWWLYTDCGVVELPDSELERWWANPQAMVQVRVYDELDGAAAGRPNFNSAAYSRDGRVWFASGVRVQMLDPSRLSQRAPAAMTHIESLTVDRKEFAPTGHLKLRPHPREVQIDYTSPELLIPQKVKFRYRLDGYERDWREAGTRRQAFYTDLPPGHYSFRAIACNSDGVWNQSAATFDFSVDPAYYQTSWFRALCVTAFLAALWGLYRLRLYQVAREFTAQLDGRVDERLRVARDLHDTLLQTFQAALIQMQAGYNLLSRRPEKAAETLQKAITISEGAIAEGREAIQNMRSSTVTKNDLARALRVAGDQMMVEGSARFDVKVQGLSRDVHPILRDEVYRIALEALRNAFKHAEAKAIEAEIVYGDSLRVRIRDDGKGIDPANLGEGRRPGHYGLLGMRERAARIGGKLDVWSGPGAGTEIQLTIPGKIAFRVFGAGSLLRRFRRKSKSETAAPKADTLS